MTMQWAQLLSFERLGSRKNHIEQARSPFHKDYDRIVFSQSFRQLNRKTQVHPLTQNDGIHTRLTHSLEVSCIGRSLGMLAAEKMQGLPEWVTPADIGAIIQAACLAHDIGNPPFGHAGEYAIRDWFSQPAQATILQKLEENQIQDVCQYEGNAQGLRVLSRLEYHPEEGGMRLTYATMGAFLKYPWVANSTASQQKGKKFGCYQSEKNILLDIAQHLGLLATGQTQAGKSHVGTTQMDEVSFCRHPLTYLLEAADDICYALIDLEDGLLLGMLDYRDVEPLLLSIIGSYGAPDEIHKNVPTTQKMAALRGRAMKRLVEEVTDAFAAHEAELLAGTLKGTLLDYCSTDLSSSIEAAKNLARHKIFNHPQKAGLELLASASLHTLLNNFIPLVLVEGKLSFREQRLLLILQHHGVKRTGVVYDDIMQMLDMITALSDHQAYALAQELSGHRSGVF